MNGEGSGVAVGSQAKADVNENIEFLHPLFTAADPLAFSFTAPTDKDHRSLLSVQPYYPYYRKCSLKDLLIKQQCHTFIIVVIKLRFCKHHHQSSCP